MMKRQWIQVDRSIGSKRVCIFRRHALKFTLANGIHATERLPIFWVDKYQFSILKIQIVIDDANDAQNVAIINS